MAVEVVVRSECCDQSECTVRCSQGELRCVPELVRTPDVKYSMMYLVDPKIRSAYERRIKDHDRVKHMSELDVKQVAAALSYSAMFIHFI